MDRGPDDAGKLLFFHVERGWFGEAYGDIDKLFREFCLDEGAVDAADWKGDDAAFLVADIIYGEAIDFTEAATHEVGKVLDPQPDLIDADIEDIADGFAEAEPKGAVLGLYSTSR